MEAGPLSDGRVVDKLKDSLVVRVDSDERTDLVQRFEIQDLPALVFLRPDGGEVWRFGNAYEKISSEQFLREVDTAVKRRRDIDRREAQLRQALEKKPEDPQTHRDLGDYYYALGLLAKAEHHYREALSAVEGSLAAEKPQERRLLVEAVSPYLVHLELRQGNYAEVIEAAESFLAQRPGPGSEPQLLYYKGQAHRGLKQREQSRKCFDEVIRRFPDTRWSRLAQRALRY